MPKKKLIRQGDFPYHVTTRNNNRDWFSIPMNEVWHICKESLIYAQEKEKVQINCFVLMSNHYHLLLTTPDENIDRFMMHFNWRISYLISLRTSRINHKFSNRYKWSIVQIKIIFIMFIATFTKIRYGQESLKLVLTILTHHYTFQDLRQSYFSIGHISIIQRQNN